MIPKNGRRLVMLASRTQLSLAGRFKALNTAGRPGIIARAINISRPKTYLRARLLLLFLRTSPHCFGTKKNSIGITEIIMTTAPVNKYQFLIMFPHPNDNFQGKAIILYQFI